MKIYDVCPTLELVEENIEWEEIPFLNDFELLCKSIDDLPEHEQTEFIADLIINCFTE